MAFKTTLIIVMLQLVAAICTPLYADDKFEIVPVSNLLAYRLNKETGEVIGLVEGKAFRIIWPTDQELSDTFYELKTVREAPVKNR